MNSDSHFLISRIQSFGERPALVAEEREWTYGDLFRRVLEARDFLARKEERVLLVGRDYGIDSIALLLAGIESDKILAPVTAERDEDFEKFAQACGADGWVDAGADGDEWKFSPFAGNPEGAKPKLICDLLANGRSGLVLFSSGMTGIPKAMLHDYGRFVTAYENRRTRSDSIFLFLLFDHIGGLDTMFGGFASGMTLVAPPNRSPETVAGLIEKFGVSVLPTTPTFLTLMLMDEIPRRFDLSSLKIIAYGAEPMPDSLLERVGTTLPHVRLVQRYGTTETGVARTLLREDNRIHIDDPGLQTKVVDGELWLKSGTQVLGYLNEDNARFTDDGWFRTGDAVEVEGDGSLRFLGRKVEMINVGGEKVYPGEVEAVLLQLPEVGACRVFGVKNAILGQVVAVEVVPNGSFEPPALRSLIRRHARQNLQRHKVPVEIKLVDDIPMNLRGKRELGG